MSVFNNDYKKNAYMELEKDISKLESQRTMPDKDDMARFNANVQFAQRINLINLKKAKEYRERAARLEYSRRTQTGIIDDAYENPLEREIRYSSMEALKEEIAHERESTAASQNHEANTKAVESTKSVEHDEVVRSR